LFLGAKVEPFNENDNPGLKNAKESIISPALEKSNYQS